MEVRGGLRGFGESLAAGGMAGRNSWSCRRRMALHPPQLVLLLVQPLPISNFPLSTIN
jgi:hypothetical protein